MDDLDSTFVFWPGLDAGDGSSPTVSLENAPQFPGYYLTVDANTRRITLVDGAGGMTAAYNATASFYVRPGFTRSTIGGGPPSLSAASVGSCAFESVAYPGTFISSFNETITNHKLDTPCHYADCVAVYAFAPSSSTAHGSVGQALPPSDFNTSSSWIITPPNNGMVEAMTNFSVGGLAFSISNVSGTIASVNDVNAPAGFSYTPADAPRQATGYHHLGDVTLRFRPYASLPSTPYTEVTTAVVDRHGPVAPMVAGNLPGSIWASDVTPVLAASAGGSDDALLGLTVVREYTPAPDGLGIIMSLVVTNTNNASSDADATIEIGGLGVSMVFNQDWSGLSLEQAAAQCSFAEPYIGVDGGYVKVTPMPGQGPVMIVAPSWLGCNLSSSVDGCGGGLEAWRMLSSDPTPRSVTFEGFYSYVIHSKAWADNEWVAAQPWNEASSLVLKPGQVAVHSLRLWTVPAGLEGVDQSLTAAGLPVVRGRPGYVLTSDMTTASLEVVVPAGMVMQGIQADPPGVVVFGVPVPSPGPAPSTFTIPVTVLGDAEQGGRVRATITYAANSSDTSTTPPLSQSVHLFVLPPLASHIDAYTAFTAAYAWYDDTSDPFGRAFSFMDYDASVSSVMEQEERVFVVGLSDEAGAGSGLGIAFQTRGKPDVGVATLIATYVNKTLLGTKADGQNTQVSIATSGGTSGYGVRASMFWGPGMPGYNYSIPCNGWACWDEARAETTWRAYNYPHPAMVLYSMYRLTRDNEDMGVATLAYAASSSATYPGLVGASSWDVYLRAAANTIIGMWTNAGPSQGSGFLAQFGLMVGSGYGLVLSALLEEAAAAGPGDTEWSAYAATIDAIQRNRTAIWASLPFPYGSEMPWDSTGQEEVFTFTQAYGSYRTSNLTLAAVKAYTPDLPHWAYHGSSRRYFDFGVNGKIMSAGPTERALHHYGAGINSVVLLSAYMLFPNDTYAVRAGFAASWGCLTTIDLDTGAPSMGWHGDASLLVAEPYTADHGIGMYGGSRGWGCYVHNESSGSGLVSGYGCDIVASSSAGSSGSSGSSSGSGWVITPYDPHRRLVYIGMLGLRLQLRTSSFASLTLDLAAPSLTINFNSTYSGGSGAILPGGVDGACPGLLFASIRLAIDTPAHPEHVHAANIVFTAPGVQPPVVRGAYELPCNTTSATITWTAV